MQWNFGILPEKITFVVPVLTLDNNKGRSITDRPLDDTQLQQTKR